MSSSTARKRQSVADEAKRAPGSSTRAVQQAVDLPEEQVQELLAAIIEDERGEVFSEDDVFAMLAQR